MGTISEQIRENRKRSKKIAITITAIVLAAVIAGVAIFFVIKNNKKSEIISYQGEIVNYFTAYKIPYKNPSQELIDEYETKSAEQINRLIDPTTPTKNDFFTLYPKQSVKIEKITGIFWWIPENYSDELLNRLPDTFVTTIFTENFRITKNVQMLREVEITPSSCDWLKEVMTPDDMLSFFCGEGKEEFEIQIKNLQIYFSVV